MLAETATLQSIYIRVASNSTFFPSAISSMALTSNFSSDTESESLNGEISFTPRRSKRGRKSAGSETEHQAKRSRSRVASLKAPRKLSKHGISPYNFTLLQFI